jgi:mycobactin polyketide synthetase MbtC
MPMSDDRFTAAAEPVVIVGMAVEAPGGIDTTDGYWELLSHGREALGPSHRPWLAGSRVAGRVTAQRFQGNP